MNINLVSHDQESNAPELSLPPESTAKQEIQTAVENVTQKSTEKTSNKQPKKKNKDIEVWSIRTKPGTRGLLRKAVKKLGKTTISDFIDAALYDAAQKVLGNDIHKKSASNGDIIIAVREQQKQVIEAIKHLENRIGGITTKKKKSVSWWQMMSLKVKGIIRG